MSRQSKRLRNWVADVMCELLWCVEDTGAGSMCALVRPGLSQAIGSRRGLRSMLSSFKAENVGISGITKSLPGHPPTG